MEVIPNEEELRRYVTQALQASERHPLLIDRYLQGAIEVDVDAISDGEIVVVGGIMEHVEHAGIHSGDSACALPPTTLSAALQQELTRQTKMLARELGVIGLINIQYAIYGGEVFILEVNPRASRTIPFVSKAIGVPLAKYAALVMAGKKLREIGLHDRARAETRCGQGVGVSFRAIPGRRYDPRPGDEIDRRGDGNRQDLRDGVCQGGAGGLVESAGCGAACLSASAMTTSRYLEPIARGLVGMGFELIATRGTADHIRNLGLKCESINKVLDGSPHIVDAMKEGRVAMVVNTPDTNGTKDPFSIRRTALELRLPYFTTMAGAKAAVEGIFALKNETFEVHALQDYHRKLQAGRQQGI